MSTEYNTLVKQVELGNAYALLNSNPNYLQVIKHLFDTTPSDLMKGLGLLEQGSTEYIQRLRLIDALSSVRILLERIPEDALRAQEDLDQLRTIEDE